MRLISATYIDLISLLNSAMTILSVMMFANDDDSAVPFKGYMLSVMLVGVQSKNLHRKCH